MATAKPKLIDNESDASDVTAQLEALKSDLAALTETMADLAAAKGEKARARVASEAEALAENAKAQMATAQGEAERAAAQTGNMIRQNPAAAVGIAAAVGFLFGYFSQRR